MNIYSQTNFDGEKPSVISIKKNDKIQMMTIGLAEKQVLAKHSTSVPATLLVLRGKLDFNMGAETIILRDGDVFEIPVNTEHEVIGRDVENIFLITKEL